jgi:hypothetical protein
VFSGPIFLCFPLVREALVEKEANSNVKPHGRTIPTAAFSPSGIA